MAKKIKAPAAATGPEFIIVKNEGALDSDAPLLFTFSNFKFFPINIDGIFNNYFETEDEFTRKVAALMGKALPLLSNENYSLFNDCAKTSSLHLHRLHGKENILKQIFQEYQFTETAINNFLDGAEIYQLEVPFENGATRVVFERIDNLISFLFLDPNHHIYMNSKLVDRAHSLFYEYCPVYEAQLCERQNYLHTCFAFEFLDEEAFNKTYGNTFDPNDV